MKKILAVLVALVIVPVFMVNVAFAATDTGSVAGVTNQTNVTGDVKGASTQKSFWESNWYIILLVLAVLGGGAYWFLVAKKKNSDK